MVRKYLIIPVIVYEGLVEITNQKLIHPLHKFLLNLSCSEHNLEKVLRAFQLDKRVIMESIIDLMYREMIFVDFENSKIYPSSAVATAVDQGNLESYLGLSFPESKKFYWIQDARIGQICMLNQVEQYFYKPRVLDQEFETLDLDLEHQTNMKSKYQVQISQRNYVSLPNVSPKSLVKAAKMQLREYISEGNLVDFVKKVHKFKIINNETLYLPLKTIRLKDQHQLIPDCVNIPPEVVETWIKATTNLDPYSISDSLSVPEEFLYNYDWNILLEKINLVFSKVGEIKSKPINSKDFRKLCGNLLHYLETYTIPTVLPKMKDFGSPPDHTNVFYIKGEDILLQIQTKISQASKFLIIGSGFVNNNALEDLASIFKEKLSNQISIILIWGGLGNNCSYFKRKASIFEGLNVHCVKSEEPFHSKFLLIDDKFAWISSCNFLSYSYDSNSAEENICEFSQSSALFQLIEYSRDRFRHKIALLKDFDVMLEDMRKTPNLLFQQNISQIEFLLNDCISDLHILRRKSASNDVAELFYKKIKQIKQIMISLRNTTTAVLIENLDHRKFLRSTLENCRTHVSLGTDRVIRGALGPVIISAFNDALKLKAVVNVQWGREPTHSQSEDVRKIKGNVQYLKSQTKNQISIPNNPSHSHAKFLVMDDHLSLITSYNLLAFAGNGLSDEDITDELGIVVSCRKNAQIINKKFPPVTTRKIKENNIRKKKSGKNSDYKKRPKRKNSKKKNRINH